MKSEVEWNGSIPDWRNVVALSLCLVGGMGWLHFVFGWTDEHQLTSFSVSSRFVGPTCHTPASSSPTCSPPYSLSAPACRRRKLHNPPRRCPPSARALRARHAAPPPAASTARCCYRGLCTLPCDAGAPPPRRDPLGPAFRLRVVLHAGPSSASAPLHALPRPELRPGWSTASASCSTPTGAWPPAELRLHSERRPCPGLGCCRSAEPHLLRLCEGRPGKGRPRSGGGAAAGVPPARLRAELRPLRLHEQWLGEGRPVQREGPPPECHLPASVPSSARSGRAAAWRGAALQWVRGCAAARAGSADRRGRRRVQRG